MSDPKPNANVPQIPQPLADVGALAVAMRFVKQGIDSLAGYRGNANDRAVTFNDLINLGAVSGDAGSITSVTAIVAGAGLAGGTITGTGTISLGPINGNQLLGNPGTVLAVPTGVTVGAGLTLTAGHTLVATSPLQGYLFGCEVTVASTTTFSVAAGQTMSDDNTTMITVSALTKSSAGTWVVGNASNGLDAGTIANSTWYHIFVIYNPTSNIQDILLSTSASAPTLPSGYTKKRRIGSLLTDGSAHFITFIQNGDRFDWSTPVQELSATPGVTTAVTQTLTAIPTGVIVEAILSGTVNDATTSDVSLYISSLAQTDVGASATTAVSAITGSAAAATSFGGYSGFRVITNTSAQVRRRVNSTTTSINIITNGWIDRRGK